MRATAVAFVGAAALVACVEAEARWCGDRVCPASLVCAPSGDGCAEPAQVEACRGHDAGATCELVGVGAGLCRDGLCVVAACGDGVLDPGEACDDGTDNGPDAACLEDCKRPTCGDGALQGDEQCDDGAANGDDRSCLSTCVVATCGDGRRLVGDGSTEECDAGAANSDEGACTTGCAVARCGDGKRWAGVEACDDHNELSGDGCRADCRKVEACGDASLDDGEACDDGNGNPADGCDACVPTAWQAEAVIGSAPLAPEVAVGRPSAAAYDLSGNLYVSDLATHRVFKIDAASNVLTTIAGTGVAGASGDGGPATSARLNQPGGVWVDGGGDLYIADTGNHRVRRVLARDGTIATVAGSGVGGFSGDGGLATAAALKQPRGVVVDGLGNLYIGDTGNGSVRRVDPGGIITTYAGVGAPGIGTPGVPAATSPLGAPWGLALRANGDLLVADSSGCRIWRVEATTGVLWAVAGTGTGGFAGDGGPALGALLGIPTGVGEDPDGNVFFVERFNKRLRRVDAQTAVISSVVNGLGEPQGLVVDGAGWPVVANTLRAAVDRVDPVSGAGTRLAGTGFLGGGGEGAAATSALLAYPADAVVESSGDVLVADGPRIVRVAASSGTLTTIAGTGVRGYGGDNGPALAAALDYVEELALDGAGNVYVADMYNHRIRRIDAATGVITTVAGTGAAGNPSEGAPAASAPLRYPGGVAVAPSGDVYFADTNNHRVWRIWAATGTLSLVAGTGAAGSAGDGGFAVLGQVSSPRALAFDASGNLFIADSGNHRVRRVDPNGRIWRVSNATISMARGVAADDAGFVYVSSPGDHRVRRIDVAFGNVTVLAGTGAEGNTGDGGPAASASLRTPAGVSLDADGNVLIADNGNGRVRRIGGDGHIATVVGAVWPESEGPLELARLATPAALTLIDGDALLAGGAAGVVQRLDGARAWLGTVAGRYPHGAATGTLARFRDVAFGDVRGVAWDAAGQRIYLTEGHVVHVVTTDAAGAGVLADEPSTWTIAVLAGAAGQAGASDGALAAARFRSPSGLYFDDEARVLYVADTGNHAIRAIDVDGGLVTTVAGTAATLGYFGDGGAATDALLYAPSAITLAPAGDLFIADAGNHRVRRVEAGSGVITTVLGDGVAASSGEGAPAWTFPVADPQGLATDALGNLFVSSSTAVRLLPASDAGIVDGTGAVQTIYGAAPRDTFPALATACLTGVAVVDGDTTWVTDRCAGLLVELWRQPVAP